MITPTKCRRQWVVKKHINMFSGLLLVIFLGIACSPFKPQQRPSPEGELPRTFSLYTATFQPVQRWWQEFEDPDLDTLIDAAFSGNLSLKKPGRVCNKPDF